MQLFAGMTYALIKDLYMEQTENFPC
uniref:Uncharacterized protein n=1 Tax=Arundo donax TaxID=35708 RepID=A0A0A9BET4_ARUDO